MPAAKGSARTPLGPIVLSIIDVDPVYEKISVTFKRTHCTIHINSTLMPKHNDIICFNTFLRERKIVHKKALHLAMSGKPSKRKCLIFRFGQFLDSSLSIFVLL